VDPQRHNLQIVLDGIAENVGGQPSKLQTTLEWATRLNKLPPLDRYAQLNGALRLLKDMLGGVSTEDLKSEKVSSALVTVTTCIAEWMRYKPRSFSTKHAARYQELDRLVRDFSRRMPSQAASRLLRYDNGGTSFTWFSLELIDKYARWMPQCDRVDAGQQSDRKQGGGR
jgi:hypothetical protein